MQRTQVRRALIVAVVVSLTALGFMLGRTISSRREASDADTGRTLLPEVSQRIEEFRRVKVKDGKKMWELAASEAQYFEDRGEVVVESPDVSFYAGDGQTIRISGSRGRVHLADAEVERIDLEGSIQVRVGDYLIETERALYVQGEDSVYAPGHVRISGASMALEGEVMVVELGTQRVRVLNGVSTTFRRAESPAAAGPPGIGGVARAAAR